ncbi:type II toxin-antitoxin system death-on-curing family toxin [Sporichthya brevicatena]|uniref:Type II toxin-antitoxin system death-on-curing family toxin n=1 Tax=Sporichthya brevicatena TaxID=171442 RepID=A0ABN1GTF1_9ACTN
MTEYLSVEDLLLAAAQAVKPARPLLRDPGALAAAAARPQTTVFGEDAYDSLATKAAALLHAITRNHPLVDGNKRLGWLATRAFCELNGFDFHIPDIDAAEQFVVDVAAGRLDVPAAAAVIASHLKPRPTT